MSAPSTLYQEFVYDPIPVLRELGNASERRLAAVAYVTRDWLNLSCGDILICDGSNSAIATGQTCRELLKNLFDRGVILYSNSMLHAKVAVFDFQTAFVGSANLSEFASQQIECGLITTHRATVDAVIRFVYRLQAESDLIDESFLERIENLRIEKRKLPRDKKRENAIESMKHDKSGVSYWFFKGTAYLSEKAQEIGNQMQERWVETVEEPTSDDFTEVPEDQDPLYFASLCHHEKRWVNDLQLGDRVFWCYEDEEWGWIVLPAMTVVSRELHGQSLVAGVVGHYWDRWRSIYLERFLSSLELPKNASLRRMNASQSQLKRLLENWDDVATQ